MSKHKQDPGKKQAELAFIKEHTNADERRDITTRSENSPGQRALERVSDRTGKRADAMRALDGPAKAAHAGKLSRARRNAAAKRKS